MRTTLELDDDLARRATEVAARERKPFAELVEEGLRMRLSASESPTDSLPFPVFQARTGLAPGIDPVSNRTLFEAAEAAEDTGSPS